jgi:CheY-like chemotaxis protein
MRPAGMRGTILVAEDDPNDALLLRRAFNKAALKAPLVFVTDGEQVIEYLEGKGRFSNRSVYPLPALLVLDLRMPRFSGLEVLEWLAKQSAERQVPVVVFTGSAAPGEINRAYALGAETCLIKPQNPEDMVLVAQSLEAYCCEPTPANSPMPG